MAWRAGTGRNIRWAGAVAGRGGGGVTADAEDELKEKQRAKGASAAGDA
jgi:hypothetical protein